MLLVDKTSPPASVIIGPTADKNFTYVSVCKASSATPGYFSSPTISKHEYVDFSVSSSNPSLHFFLKTYKTPWTTSGVFVSFGNGGCDPEATYPNFRTQSLAAGARTTLSRRYMLESAWAAHDQMARLLKGSPWKYCRLNPPFSAGMHEYDANVLKTVRDNTTKWLEGNKDFDEIVSYLQNRQTKVVR